MVLTNGTYAIETYNLFSGCTPKMLVEIPVDALTAKESPVLELYRHRLCHHPPVGEDVHNATYRSSLLLCPPHQALLPYCRFDASQYSFLLLLHCRSNISLQASGENLDAGAAWEMFGRRQSIPSFRFVQRPERSRYVECADLTYLAFADVTET